ncbi:hypothetical protein EV121DRAFT_218908 [Schizophyllum commune]
MDVSSSSSSPSHVLYRWGSDFVSRPEGLPAIEPSRVRSPKATSPPVDFALPLKPSAEFPYAPLTPRSLDYVNDPILSPLSLLSLTAVGPHGRMHLAEDIIVQWIDLEFRLVAIREMLLRDVDQGTLPLRYRSCAVPTSYGYRKIYSTRRAVWRRAAHSRDAFAVLIGECHYLALMNGKLLDRSGRVHVSSLDIMLTSAGTFMHDVWLTTFVNIFDKPVAGFVASIADIENSFWLSRLPRTAPMYVWWGDSAQLSLHVKRGERLPALVVPCRPSSQDFARAEVASADTVVGTSGPPRFQSDGESDDAFMRRRQEWYTASAAVLLPTHGHVGVVQAFEWIKDSRGQMRREPIPPMFFHPAFEHYLDNEKIYDASRSEWDFCWAGYKKDVALFNQGLDEKGIGETGLADGMLPDAQVLRSAEEREASKAILGSVDDVRLGSKDTVHAEDDGPLRSGSLDGAVETTVPVILSAVPTPSAQSAASSSAGPSSTVLDADCRPSPDGAAEGSRPGGGSACDSGHRMGRRPDGAPPADASVATQGVSCQKSGGVDRKGKEPSSASPFGRATRPGLGWRPWNYRIDHIDVGEYLRQRRLHYTLERAAAAFKRGGILGRIARDLHPTDQMLSFVYGKPSPAKPLILCTFEDGTTVADEDITCEDLDILIGTYFVANNPVDRFNTKKVTFWPTEFIFNSKGPYCGVWTRDAEEWYLQRRDVLHNDGQQGLTGDQWRAALNFAHSANKLHRGGSAIAARFIEDHPDIYLRA